MSSVVRMVLCSHLSRANLDIRGKKGSHMIVADIPDKNEIFVDS